MNWQPLLDAGCAIRPDARMADFTTFRIGGSCPCVITCELPAQLLIAVRTLDEAGLSRVLIGAGSNLLVSDDGVPAAVIRYHSGQLLVREEDGLIEVTASMLLDDLARVAAERGWDGLGCCSGIPGTVGGAIAGNAGAFGEQIGDAVESVELLSRGGRALRVPGSDLEFTYRASRLQKSEEAVVSARLHFTAGDSSKLLARRAEVLALRREKHPDWRTQPTAGSFFKNIEPTSAAERRQAAGFFLDQVGAKPMRVGGARVFEKHANIIIAEPGATARDVLELSKLMAAAVRAKFGLTLVPEVRMLGRV